MPYMGSNKGLDAQRDWTLKTADGVRAARPDSDRLMKSLFSDPRFPSNARSKPCKLMSSCFAGRPRSCRIDYLGISLYDLSPGEMAPRMGGRELPPLRDVRPSGVSWRSDHRDAKALLRNIIQRQAKEDRRRKGAGRASLRFGHDVNVIRCWRCGRRGRFSLCFDA